MNKEKKIPGHILSLFIILLSISGVCLLMYKAQFRFNLHQPIEYVMMTTHKPTGTITSLALSSLHSSAVISSAGDGITLSERPIQVRA